MKKYILVFLFISSFLKADYLFVGKYAGTDFAHCIKSYEYYNYNGTDFLSFDNPQYTNNTYYALSALTDYKIQSGYIKDGDICKLVTDKLSTFEIDTLSPLNPNTLSYLGLSDSDLNLMFAFSGLLTSFLFLFGLFRWI